MNFPGSPVSGGRPGKFVLPEGSREEDPAEVNQIRATGDSGPTTKPRRALSVTMAVDTGPGVTTAPKPTTKEKAKRRGRVKSHTPPVIE